MIGLIGQAAAAGFFPRQLLVEHDGVETRGPAARRQKRPPVLHLKWRRFHFGSLPGGGTVGCPGGSAPSEAPPSGAAMPPCGLAPVAPCGFCPAPARGFTTQRSPFLSSVYAMDIGWCRALAFGREGDHHVRLVLPEGHGGYRHGHGSQVQILARGEVIHHALLDRILILDTAMAACQGQAEQHGNETSHALIIPVALYGLAVYFGPASGTGPRYHHEPVYCASSLRAKACDSSVLPWSASASTRFLRACTINGSMSLRSSGSASWGRPREARGLPCLVVARFRVGCLRRSTLPKGRSTDAVPTRSLVEFVLLTAR